MYSMYALRACISNIPRLYSMYVVRVCILCMCSMYVFYVFYLCILCMYSTYAFRIFVCKASWLSRPPGAKNQWKQHLRIQEGHFLKIALNLVLTLPDDGECPALLISCGIDLGAFCVELWSFFVSERISVPMSYITCLDICAKNKNTADKLFLILRVY